MGTTPEQEIFDEVFKIARKHCERVYDVRPMKEADYPFVDLGPTQTLTQPNKNTIKGFVIVEVNVWGLPKHRNEISTILNNILLEAVKMRYTESYAVYTDIQASNIRMQEDNSTNTRLKRGILELQISF